MVATRVAQVVDAAWRAGGQLGVELPVIQDPQRVDLQPPPGVIGQAVFVLAEVVDQRLRDMPGGRSRRRWSSGTRPHP